MQDVIFSRTASPNRDGAILRQDDLLMGVVLHDPITVAVSAAVRSPNPTTSHFRDNICSYYGQQGTPIHLNIATCHTGSARRAGIDHDDNRSLISRTVK